MGIRKKGGLLVVFVLAFLVWGGLRVAQAQGDTSWVGEYFNNASLSGAPVVVRSDQAIKFMWNLAAPDPALPADRFSVRWTRAQFFTGGTYRFIARSDDGMRVYLDNVLILDSWFDRAPDPPVIVEVSVTQGQHALRVEYYENSGAAVASLDWILVSSPGVATWIAQY